MDIGIEENLTAEDFLTLAHSVWPGEYAVKKVDKALNATINITARNEGILVGCLRILTDGYFFSTIPEALVLPEYQGQGIGTRLFSEAKEVAPTSLFFGAQPEKEDYYLKRGFEKSLQSFQYKKPRSSNTEE